jgi:hypothetical protein
MGHVKFVYNVYEVIIVIVKSVRYDGLRKLFEILLKRVLCQMLKNKTHFYECYMEENSIIEFIVKFIVKVGKYK